VFLLRVSDYESKRDCVARGASPFIMKADVSSIPSPIMKARTFPFIMKADTSPFTPQNITRWRAA
jgi:hypothetical protein